MNKTIYACIHTHKYGVEIYLAKSATRPRKKQFVEHFNIDFEPDKEEFLDIVVASAAENMVEFW